MRRASPAGLTAYGGMQQEFEAHVSMLANGISFVSYDVTALPNRFVALRARAARHAGDLVDGARPGGGGAQPSRMPTR